jgi:hypothetical protein
MTCPNCGWGWATTYIDPIQEDDTVYVVYLGEGNVISKATIKTVATISNINYMQAKKMMENNPSAIIFSGNAVQVRDILLQLKSLSLTFKVEPDFPYPLTKEDEES